MAAAPSIKSLEVSTPSRLHFGLLSIGDSTVRKFGGAGLMIDAPRTLVHIQAAKKLKLNVPTDSKTSVDAAVASWQRHFAPADFRDVAISELPVEIEVSEVSRHSGLGSGTQLVFAVALALQIGFGLPIPKAEEFATALNRGKRSAIGSYGFFQGGFLVDRGIANESVAPLDARIDFPEDWKIVLVRPDGCRDVVVHGDVELNAFANLPATTQQQADDLTAVLRDRIVPAVLQKDFTMFAESVTEYGYVSGMYYSDAQGGAYASSQAEAIVQKIRSLGDFAVGQSSWGPTIFAIGSSEKVANWLVEKLAEGKDDVACQAEVVSADNRGVTVTLKPAN